MGKLVTLHMWIGVSAGFFLVMMAVTGLVLDHEDQFSPNGTIAITNTLALARGARLDELPVSPSTALQIAFAHVSEGVTIHRLELRTMGGGLVYNLETQTNDEMYIDPVTGAVHQDGQDGVNLVRMAKMLHTGEGLLNFPWLYDAIALALLTLVLSGACLLITRR
jgi:uncharacterized iron-regulated membrane protein